MEAKYADEDGTSDQRVRVTVALANGRSYLTAPFVVLSCIMHFDRCMLWCICKVAESQSFDLMHGLMFLTNTPRCQNMKESVRPHPIL